MPWQNYLLGWFLRLPLLVVYRWVFVFSFLFFLSPVIVFAETTCSYGGSSLSSACGNWLASTPRTSIWFVETTLSNDTVITGICHANQFDENWSKSTTIDMPVSCNLKGCPAGVNPITGQCISDDCPSGQHYSTDTATCVPDPPPPDDNCPNGDLSGSSTDGSCDCPVGKEKVGSSCQDPCPNGKHRNQETGACDDNCTNGMLWNGSACGCPEGSYYGQVNGQDSCIAGSGNDGSGSGSGDTSGGSSGSGDDGTSSGGTGGTGSSGSGDSGGSSSGGDTSGGTGSSGTGSGGSGSGTGSGTGTGIGTVTGTGSGTGSGTGTGTGTGGSTCASGLTNPDGTCFVSDTGPDLSGITSRLDALINKIPSTLPPKTPGSFPTTSDDSQIAGLKSDISAQYALIKSSIIQMFQLSAVSGVGSLPCYRNLPLFGGKTFSICFSDYEDELSIIPLFIYASSFIIAAFIVLGGKKND